VSKNDKLIVKGPKYR